MKFESYIGEDENERAVEVEYDYSPEEGDGFREPHLPASIEITAVVDLTYRSPRCKGHDVTDDVSDADMKRLKDKAWDDFREQFNVARSRAIQL